MYTMIKIQYRYIRIYIKCVSHCTYNNNHTYIYIKALIFILMRIILKLFYYNVSYIILNCISNFNKC